MKFTALALGLFLAAGQALAATPSTVDVAGFVRKDQYGMAKISPTGEYVAAVVKLEDRDAFVVMRRADRKTTSSVQFGQHQYIGDFDWANGERVVLEMAHKFGALDTPYLTGEIFAVDVNGKDYENLIGFRVDASQTESRIKSRQADPVDAFLIDDLDQDDKNVLIYTYNYADHDPIYQVEKLNVQSGARGKMFKAPVRRAHFVTDSSGVIRFATGSTEANMNQVYYRDGDAGEWKLINDQTASRRIEGALGLSADGKTGYLQVKNDKGPDSIVAYDVATGQRKEIARDAVADPHDILMDGNVPIGVRYMDGKPRDVFFDEAAPLSKLYRALAGAFGGESPFITSTSSDGNLVMVQTTSDRNPGDYYLFDRTAKKADHMMSVREWLAPGGMAAREPIKLTARDGLVLHGYYTRPKGSTGRVPLIVLPHGGPFAVRDDWTFDEEAQLLAAAGYGVLQVNFRGSPGYGWDFQVAGAQEWGGKMQDDLTDATRWAVEQGLADGSRMCIYGASYGGYAALMGAAKEPDLYKCAVGYVGVYDLPQRLTDDGMDTRRNESWSADWMGKADALAGKSPNRLADRIKIPVFLAAGGEDMIVKVAHTKMMEAALKKAGVPVETLYFDREGHGFYQQAHKVEYYTLLLGFLNRHLGGALPGGAAAAK
jgi:dipeptidyl aminopeptidase/acylaminoacyl peptidase